MTCPCCNKEFSWIYDKVEVACIAVWGKCQKCLDKMLSRNK